MHLISRSFAGGFEGFDKRIQMHFLIKMVPLPQVSNVSIYLSSAAWVLQVRRLLTRIRPDVLDAHFIGVPGYLGVASGFHPLSLTPLGSDILIIPKKNPVYRFLTKYALKKADVVVCDSETVKRELLQLGANHRKIRVIYNGVDTHKFDQLNRSEALRRELDVLGVPAIISIRMLRPVYNVEMLVRAVPLILEQTPEARFIIAGDGEQGDYLKSLASSLGVSNSIRFVGWISHNELPKYLASSDIYVSTSLSDSTSLSLQEAMACELPPVATDLPANREWIMDGENGFIVPINDAKALANRLVYLVRNGDMRRKFGKLGREIIRERAEYEREMAKVEQLYESVASGRLFEEEKG